MEAETVESPYPRSPSALRLRGNLHAHTTRSDGVLDPQQVVDAYAALGYDFLALSDHDITPDLDGLDPRGMILIPAREISSPVGHMLAAGPRALEPVPPGMSGQEFVDFLTAGGALAVLCHPSWGRTHDHYTVEQLKTLTGYDGIEIFNGGVTETYGSSFAGDKWDQILAADRIVWGLACDDGHFERDIGRGWCVVLTDERSPQAVLDAVRAGSFYASSGVTIETVEADGPRVHVVAPDADLITVIGEAGAQLASASGTEITYDACECLSPSFRIECHGRRGRKAWTQPFVPGGGTLERYRAMLREKPVFEVPVRDRAPALAGDLSDPAWETAAVTDRFVRHEDGRHPEVRTEMRCLIADGSIFFGFLCEEPFQDRVKAGAGQDGRSSIWTDDSMEIFLDTEGSARRYVQVIVNAAGACWAGEQGRVPGRPRVPAVRAASGRRPGAWTAECAVSLSGMDADASSGRWGFNAVRNRCAASGRFTWTLVGPSNHTPERFGVFSF